MSGEPQWMARVGKLLTLEQLRKKGGHRTWHELCDKREPQR
jgi:hypothetical protein